MDSGAARHLDELIGRRPALGACRAEIVRAYELLLTMHADGGTLYLCGNGGSAADAEHWAGELMKSFELRRHGVGVEGVSEPLRSKLEQGVRAVPLTGFVSLRTAVANDTGADVEFAQPVWVLAKPGDVVCGITTSGNSANVCLALEAGRARGAATLALTGAGGGRCAELADVCVAVPESRTLLVQELHLPVYHTLSLMLEAALFGG